MSLAGREILLDTGPLVAMLDPQDQGHTAVVDVFPDVMNRLVTTEAAITEAAQLLARNRKAAWRPLGFVLDAGIPVLALHLPAHERCLGLMRRYEDIGMDYADASLVALADALGLRRVFTLDRRGFGAYRTSSGHPFQLIPQPA